METYMWILIGIMTAAGLLGGAVNHFLSEQGEPLRVHFVRSLWVGLAASFMVPLFLNMISSNLIDSIRGSSNSPGDKSKLFVFAGFCLIAAISSRAFIRTLSDRVLREAKEAKDEARQARADVVEVQSAIEPIVAKETEMESTPEEMPASVAQMSVEDDEKTVLGVLANSRWTLRSLSGVAGDTKIDKGKCAKILENLVDKGLVGKKSNDRGTRWFITEKGRFALRAV